MAAATAGDSRGYLVLEFTPQTPIETLTAPGARLARHSARALIVTVRSQAPGDTRAPAGAGHDDLPEVALRYFAPQYGVPEDAATGSAMRVLAHFWQQRGLDRNLRARQRSRAGGLLFSRIGTRCTWVGGHVTHGSGDAL